MKLRGLWDSPLKEFGGRRQGSQFLCAFTAASVSSTERQIPPKVAACFSYYETLLTMGSVLNDYNIGKRIVDDAG